MRGNQGRNFKTGNIVLQVIIKYLVILNDIFRLAESSLINALQNYWIVITRECYFTSTMNQSFADGLNNRNSISKLNSRFFYGITFQLMKYEV